MFERYTETARRSVFFARWWALNRKGLEIGTADLILGCTQEMAKTSSPFGVEHWLSETQAVELFASGVVCAHKPPDIAKLPLSINSKRALAYAAEEADFDRRSGIDPWHLVRGVLREGDSTATILIEAGFTLERIRARSAEINKGLADHRRLVPQRGWWILALLLAAFAAAWAYLLTSRAP